MNIVLNLDFFLNYKSPSKEDIKSLVVDVAKDVAFKSREDILIEARKKLNTTYSRYEKALVVEVEDNGVYLTLTYSKDLFVKALEEGMKPFDMKPKILSSPKSKISILGRKYATIPINDSFRVVSENSDPRLWIHPGLTALNLTENIDKTNILQENFVKNLNQKLVHLFSIVD